MFRDFGVNDKMNKRYTILVVEGHRTLSRLIQKKLEKTGYRTKGVISVDEAITCATNNPNTLMLLDYKPPNVSGKKIIDVLAKRQCKLPFIIIIGYGDEKVAVEMMKLGAQDYLVKGVGFLDLLPVVVKQVIEHLTAEKRLNDAEGGLLKLSHAIEQSPCTIIITNTNGKIEYINPKFTQLTGYLSEEVIGKNPSILSSGKTSPEEYKRLWNTIKSGREWRGEFCNRKKNGEIYWELASISPVKNDKGVITHFIAVKEDITRRKQAEKKLLQSEKLRSLGVMAYGIAHDFNNILTVISGNAQLLESSYRDHKELTNGLRTIRRAAHNGAETVRRMHEFTRKKSNSSLYILIDLRKLIKQAIQFTKHRWGNMAQSRDITYDLDIDDVKTETVVFGNPSELKDVFVNIINNALDAMPKGGRLSFSTWRKDDTVFVSISDTGKGMSEEVQTHIFDPFFTTRSPKRTGLGMSAVYGIMARHSGSIDVESQVGKGSTFTLRLPIIPRRKNNSKRIS